MHIVIRIASSSRRTLDVNAIRRSETSVGRLGGLFPQSPRLTSVAFLRSDFFLISPAAFRMWKPPLKR